MNNNDSTNSDPILDWFLQNDANEDTNKPISTELLSYLLTQNAATTTAVPYQQQEDVKQKDPQQQVSPDSGNSNINLNNSSPSEEDEEPTDAQLKMMPSKERRQLRNKISARNFRNRRKEYMATLESQMDQCKAENSQLKLEVKWVRGMMDKLQAENDRLRLELVLCKEGIQPSTQSTDCVTMPVSTSNRAIISPQTLLNTNTTMTTVNNDWESLYTSTTPHTTSSHSSISPNSSSYNNVYLAHAAVPYWDMSDIFAKSKQENTSSTDLIRTFPLLAPALMSIVLNHTMTMTTEQIISNSNLYDPAWVSLPSKTSKLFLNSVSDSIVYKNILKEYAASVETNIDASTTEDKEDQPEQDGHESSAMDYFVEHYCPITWVQKLFCGFVISYVCVKYPHLDSKCRAYLPICKRFRAKQEPVETA